MAQAKSEEEAPIHEGLSSAFDESVHEGEQRLGRSWASLLATGTVGGVDVGLGVFGLLVVYQRTHNELLAALTFSIGFVALVLAHSELFTENFLVPFAAVAAGRAKPIQILRLWVGTLATNLLGGWVITLVIVSGFPDLKPAAIHFGTHFLAHGIGTVTFASSVLGGALITLMTWMERGTESVTGKLAAAVACGFLLAAGGVHHAIVLSLEMFAALHAHAAFGYAAWARVLGWATLGNIVGGVGLVTILRLLQVGPTKLHQVRKESQRARKRSTRSRSSR
ncbi:MAG TPA: formate/nitrite transporter family protein [Actinomycetota bacterium]|nr:formate/nitrite transporter family protein [Actinomycetota bacterium]